jgi:hypothetical protein
MDLSPYAGREILLRFEYVTDDAYNDPGFCVDDIAIPELAYTEGAEIDGGWLADGFIRSANVVPQDWAVQVITLGKDTEIERMPISEARQGRIVVEGLGAVVDRAVLVISAMAPSTTEAASYSYHVYLE